MLKLFEGIKDYVKQNHLEASTNSWIVRLYRITALLLLIFSVVVTGKQFLGEPINCMQDGSKIKEKILNNYCFIMTTYTVPDRNLKQTEACNHESYAHPGVRTEIPDEPVKRHAYYQWIPVVLILQTISFIVPHFFWEQCEGGLIHKLLSCKTDIDLQQEIEEARKEQEKKEKERKEKEAKEKDKPEEEEKPSKPEKEEIEFKPRMQLIAEYFIKSIRTHQFLAFGWFACDILALLIVVMNFYLTNQLLGGDFSNYGLEVYNHFMNTPLNPDCIGPADRIFPKVTKCLFHKYGPSGTIVTIDSLCILALNVLNEKIYSILWFWFFFLIFLTVLWIILKLILGLVLSCASKAQMRAASIIAMRFFGAPSYASSKDLRVLANLGVSDMIFFSLLARNMTPYMYKQFAEHLTHGKKSIDGLSYFDKES